MEQLLRDGLPSLGLPGEGVPALLRYAEALVETNKVMNLTAITEPADIAASGYVCRKAARAPTLRDFLQNECGVDAAYLTIGSADARTALFSQIKTLMDNAASQSQQQTIDLQSLVSRRDVTYNTSAATVKAIMQSALAMAAAIG